MLLRRINKYMFLSNKYSKWYYSIINNSSLRILDESIYIEKHHIIPKCMGGSNDRTNIAALTAREHFICHWLLTKMTEGHFKYKMQHALGRFVQSSPLQNRNLNSRQYEIARKSIISARTGRKHSLEVCQKMSRDRKGTVSPNKGKIGVYKHTEDAKRRIRVANAGKSFEERFGIDRALEIRKRITKTKTGKPSGMLGKKHSVDTIAKMSHPRQGSKHVRKQCPHCLILDQSPRHIKYCRKIVY